MHFFFSFLFTLKTEQTVSGLHRQGFVGKLIAAAGI